MSLSSKPKERAQFFRELAQLTAAGISVTQAAVILGQEWRDKAVRQAVGQMELGLKAGGTIEEALSPSLSPMERSVIGAAERGGKLSQGFRHLEEYYHLLDATWERVRQTLLYPIFMLHAAVLLPGLVSSVTGKTSIIAGLVTNLALIWGGLILGVLAVRFILRLAERSEALDRFLMALPYVGTTRRSLALARWHAVVHFTIASSQRLDAGLREAGTATRSASLQVASNRAAAMVEDGQEFGAAVIAQPAFPREMAASLASAEFSGNLDNETLRLSRESMIGAAMLMEVSSKRLCALFYGAVVLLAAWQIFRMAGNYVNMYQNAFDQIDSW